MTPNNFLRGHRCPKCSHRIFLNTEEFKNLIYEQIGYDYELISEFKNYKSDIQVLHKTCGNVFTIRAERFMLRKKCAICYPLKQIKPRKMNTEIFKNDIFNLVGDEYQLLSEYEKSSKKVLMLHEKCGIKYYVRPNEFLQGSRCPECFRRKLKTLEEFKKEVYELIQDEYEVIGQYINTDTCIKFKHNECQNEFNMRPNDFLRGQRCPVCEKSKAEKFIKDYLIKNNINFIDEYMFDDCRGMKRPLPFDFAIFNENKCIKFLIEYDGEFHYKPIVGIENLKYQKRNDSIKTNYCLRNNIPLLRIPYWEFNNIETILVNWMINYNIKYAV
jgi:hypothetical protein